MPQAIPQRLPGRMIDVVLDVLRHLFAPQINVVIDLDGALDPARLRVALRRLLDAEPVLGCRFISRWAFPYWQRMPEGELDGCELLEVADGDREAETQRFLGRDIADDGGPQLQALLLPDPGGHRLALKFHHRVADAGGVKEAAYRLAGIYAALRDDPDHRPEVRDGSRSLAQVYRRYVPWRLPGLAWRALKELGPWLWPWRSLQYPTGHWTGDPPRFVIHHLDAPRVAALREYGRPHGATLNDLLVTGLFRGVARAREHDGSQTLRLISTADIRRHLPDRRADAMCNLSGFVLWNLGTELGERFEDTVARVVQQSRELKDDYLGLAFNLVGFGAVAPWPAAWWRPAMARLFRLEIDTGRLPFLLTNMGPIDADSLDRFGPTVRHAFLVCPAIRDGIAGAGISGYGDTLTITAGTPESALPLAELQAFFHDIDGELPGASE